MNRALLLTGGAVALSLAAGAGCLGDAPRDNPLDPNSERFVHEGRVEGRVADRADAPLDGVEVRLLPGAGIAQTELVTRTDTQGQFVFEDVREGTGYRLQVSTDGYALAEQEAFDVRAGASAQLPLFRLNALPAFTGSALRTVHISRWWPLDDLFFLEVEAGVNDADGLFDIDRVWLDIPDLGYSVVLDPQTAGQFNKVIRADSLPTPSLQGLLGRPFQLSVRDVEGSVIRSAPQQLVRVLQEIPTPAAPIDDVLLETNQPLLTWDPFSTGFTFSYRIDIYRDEINRAVRVAQFPGIPMDVTSLQVNTLPTGPYFWTLTVVDAFGNQTQSKEAAFRIP